MCPRVVPRVMPRIVPRACGSQCGAPSPVRAGTNTTPSVSSTVAAIASVSAADPTICRPSRSHCTAAPVTKIAPSVAYTSSSSGRAPCGRREQPGVGADDRAAGVGEDERARAVGALRVALVEAGLAEQGGLLVAGDAGDGELEVEERLRVGGREVAPVRDQLGERVARDAEQRAQLVGPVATLEVEQQRAARVGDVGDVPGAAGHPGDQVGVDGADRVAAGLDESPGVRLVLGEPDQLGAGEVRVQPQAGQLGHPLLVALVAEPAADRGGTTVLPHDGAARGAERLAVPQQHRLALVRDPDAPEVGGVAVPRREHGAGGLERGLPDLLGCVLHPARLREVLTELLVALGRDPSVAGDHERGDARRTGVDREDRHRSPRMIASTTLSTQAGSLPSSTRIS